MRRAALLFLVAAVVPVAAPLMSAGQQPVEPRGGVLGRGRILPRAAALEQATLEIVCRGGIGLRIEAQGGRLRLGFQPSPRLPGSDGAALPEGTCSPVDRVLASDEPTAIEFGTAGEQEAIQGLGGDSTRTWRFFVVNTNRGFFDAKRYVQQPSDRRSGLPTPREHGVRNPADRAGLKPQPLPSGGTAATSRPGNVFDMDDRAIIIVGGRQVAAGELKREMWNELRRASPPSQSFALSRKSPGPLPAQTALQTARTGSGTARLGAIEQSISTDRLESLQRDYQIDCANNEPRIGRIAGRLTPGASFTVNGMCFGAQTGALELIGQFPGGVLRPSYAEWREGAIVVVMPAVSGASDHSVALTVIRAADGKRSDARQVRFVAAREVVEVPRHYWAPSATFRWADFQEADRILSERERMPDRLNWSTADFRLAINPACTLDSMAIPPSVGSVQSVSGWENPPPHEANIRVVWSPRCTYRRTHDALYLTEERQRICGAEFEVKAWASCPIGIVP